jgi:hypothetical protein
MVLFASAFRTCQSRMHEKFDSLAQGKFSNEIVVRKERPLAIYIFFFNSDESTA